MKIALKTMEEQAYPEFKGGKLQLNAKMQVDDKTRIISGRLVPGATIGEHKHETNSEVIFILSGKGRSICDGVEELLEAGDCHYCPQGHTHCLENMSADQDLVFYAVVPEHA